MSEMTAPPAKRAKKKTFKDTFAMFLDNDKYHDISLRAKDGNIVRANRYALSARSIVFENMLLGNFREKNSDTIRVEYNGSVVRALVEYIHKDTAEMLKSAMCGPHQLLKRKIGDLADLVDAANYYYLPDLSEKVIEYIGTAMKQRPAVSPAILECCIELGLPQTLKQSALKCIFELGGVDLKNKHSVGKFSPNVLEEILKYDGTTMDDFQLFLVLKKWVDQNPGRAFSATQMLQHIKLEKIDPANLAATVAASGLVDSTMLSEAYKKQALQAKAQGVIFQPPRTLPVWKSTRTRHLRNPGTELNLLDVSRITEGKFTWTIETVRVRSIALGIVLHPLVRSDYVLGELETLSWGYFWHGEAMAWDGTEGNIGLPRFGSRSKVTLTLDLVDREKNGFLAASVDGSNTHCLFRNLRHHLAPNKGFLPAASLYCAMDTTGANHVRILDFRKLE